MAKHGPRKLRQMEKVSWMQQEFCLIWRGIQNFYTYICRYCIMKNLRITVKISLVYMRLVTSVDQIRSIRFCFYLHGFVLYTLRGSIKRCDITPAISALGEFLCISTSVGQCSLFPRLTRRTVKIQFCIPPPFGLEEKYSAYKGSAQKVGQWHKMRAQLFLPLFCPCITVTGELWTADMGSLWLFLLSWAFWIPPGCSRTVLHGVCGWWQLLAWSSPG